MKTNKLSEYSDEKLLKEYKTARKYYILVLILSLIVVPLSIYGFFSEPTYRAQNVVVIAILLFCTAGLWLNRNNLKTEMNFRNLKPNELF